jgi:hypothetical protein
VLGNSSVYTPQVVINGRGDFVGSDRKAIDRALAAARDTVVPIELGASDDAVTIGLPQKDGVAASEVILVAYQHQVLSKARKDPANHCVCQGSNRSCAHTPQRIFFESRP